MSEDRVRLETDVEVRVNLAWLERVLYAAYRDGGDGKPWDQSSAAAELTKVRNAINGGEIRTSPADC